MLCPVEVNGVMLCPVEVQGLMSWPVEIHGLFSSVEGHNLMFWPGDHDVLVRTFLVEVTTRKDKQISSFTSANYKTGQ